MQIGDVYIPDQQPESAKCPQCGMDENRVEVCKNCRFEYPTGKTSGWYNFKVIMFIILGIWVMVTIIFWMCDISIYGPGHYPYTLVDHIKAQGEDIVKLFQSIY